MLKPRPSLLAALAICTSLLCLSAFSGQNVSGLVVQAQTKSPLVVDPLAAGTINAAAVSLTAIPPRVGEAGEIKVKPGQKFQTTVRILNTSNTDLDVETFIQDFIIDADGKTPIPVREDVDNRWSLASWVVLTPSHQTIGAKKTVSVNVLIDVPKDARPGGHYAMILHQPSRAGSGTASDQSNTGINQRVGSLLYVTVDGPIDELAFIRDFTFNRSWAEYGPLPFSYSIDNQSDIHIRPTATVEIYNLFNQKVSQMTVEPQNVFPGSLRAFVGSWPVKWGFGPYTAILTVSYGNHGQVVTAKTVIWLLPITLIIIILVLLLSLITAIVIMKRRKDASPKSPTNQPTGPVEPPISSAGTDQPDGTPGSQPTPIS